MNNFKEAMIKGHDKTEYRWISGKYRAQRSVLYIRHLQKNVVNM